VGSTTGRSVYFAAWTATDFFDAGCDRTIGIAPHTLETIAPPEVARGKITVPMR
jgi:hypothetical protein